MKRLILIPLFACAGLTCFAQVDTTASIFSRKCIDIPMEQECCQVLVPQPDTCWVAPNCIIEYMTREEQQLWDY